MRHVSNDRGLTLIELLVVVLILGILVLVALPNYFGVQSGAQTAVRASNVASINTALALYQYRNNGQCPPNGPDTTITLFLNDTTYFPDGAPVDPTVTPASSTPFVTNYTAATCRTR